MKTYLTNRIIPDIKVWKDGQVDFYITQLLDMDTSRFDVERMSILYTKLVAYYSPRFIEERCELMGKPQQAWRLESSIETILLCKLGTQFLVKKLAHQVVIHQRGI